MFVIIPSILLLSNLLPTLSRSHHENGKGMWGGGQKETKEFKKREKGFVIDRHS